MTGQVLGVILLALAIFGAFRLRDRWREAARRLRAALHAEAELADAQDQAMRLGNATSWREFVRAHPLDYVDQVDCDPASPCTFWNNDADRCELVPCRNHQGKK